MRGVNDCNVVNTQSLFFFAVIEKSTMFKPPRCSRKKENTFKIGVGNMLGRIFSVENVETSALDWWGPSLFFFSIPYKWVRTFSWVCSVWSEAQNIIPYIATLWFEGKGWMNQALWAKLIQESLWVKKNRF